MAKVLNARLSWCTEPHFIGPGKAFLQPFPGALIWIK